MLNVMLMNKNCAQYILLFISKTAWIMQSIFYNSTVWSETLVRWKFGNIDNQPKIHQFLTIQILNIYGKDSHKCSNINFAVF